MSRLLGLFWLAILLPVSANANTQFSIANTDCSGDMSISVLTGVSLICAGSLTLEHGFINADTAITLYADHDLHLDHISLHAPEIIISLLSGSLTIGNNVNFSVIAREPLGTGLLPVQQPVPRPVIAWNSFDIGLNPGGVIFVGGNANTSVINRLIGGNVELNAGSTILSGQPVNSAVVSASMVPEPSTFALMLLGLGGIACKRRFKVLSE